MLVNKFFNLIPEIFISQVMESMMDLGLRKTEWKWGMQKGEYINILAVLCFSFDY